ncbi:dual specificity protein phosphatase family protein [Chelativorans salis]|uniref:Dual specificity protein phosphatase family protein n=1 Tax=Chelativorans salis TaxID=2978478 RepID=A0ABT2LJT8_9HYPH|nr:dual specificity protein phosphatase family protein [Chelativorans sp. EGI FJ00035]MCT7374506.1 dual specificity protein phosphatase family protein [Chelativorans sp. EGI FJ00035]
MLSMLFVRRIGLAILACAAVAGTYLLALHLYGNFHTVIPGELYRSATPTPERLERYHDLHGIKTIVNLRGHDDDEPWFVSEVATARKLGIAHRDFPMSADRELTFERAAKLINLLKEAEKPILIHCKAGADRSGLISALYMFAVAGISRVRAGKQLSVFYGHVGIPYLSPTYAMDRSWAALGKLLAPDTSSSREAGPATSQEEQRKDSALPMSLPAGRQDLEPAVR